MRLPLSGSAPPTTGSGDLSPNERWEIQRVLDLALGIGAVLLASGVGAVDVTASMHSVLQAYGLRRCQVDTTYDRITISYRAWVGADPQTSMHQVPTRSLDYSRLQYADRLVQDISAGRLDRSQAHAELDRIVRAPHRYPRWVATAALGMMGASLAVLLGGFLVALVAGAVAAAIDRIGRLLNQREVLPFFQQIVGAAVATAATVLLTAFNVLPGGNASLVVAASIIVLLSGMSVVGAVQDTLTGYYLTGLARGVQIALLSIALLVGVTAALRVGVAAGVEVSANPEIVGSGAAGIPLRVFAGGVAAAAAAIAGYAPPRGAFAAGLAGGGGSAVLLILGWAGTGLIPSSAVAAALIGLAGGVLSRRFRLPPLVIAMAGIMPLVPGVLTYRGFVSLTTGDAVGGLTSLSSALAVALALGAGVLLGQFVSSPVKRRLGRLKQHYRIPGLAGVQRS